MKIPISERKREFERYQEEYEEKALEILRKRNYTVYVR